MDRDLFQQLPPVAHGQRGWYTLWWISQQFPSDKDPRHLITCFSSLEAYFTGKHCHELGVEVGLRPAVGPFRTTTWIAHSELGPYRCQAGK